MTRQPLAALQPTWSIATLARRMHASPSQLRRAFAREYGMSILEHQRDVRLRHAIKQLGSDKVDATALGVGYKSKTNLYRALLLRTV